MVNTLTVVDTSVVFKWFVAFGENGLDDAATLLRAHRNGEIVLAAPATMPIEIANTLRYALPSVDDALELLDELQRIGVRIFQPTPRRVRKAASRAAETGLSIYDALFLQLAEELECPLFTADARAFTGIDSTSEVRVIDS